MKMVIMEVFVYNWNNSDDMNRIFFNKSLKIFSTAQSYSFNDLVIDLSEFLSLVKFSVFRSRNSCNVIEYTALEKMANISGIFEKTEVTIVIILLSF